MRRQLISALLAASLVVAASCAPLAGTSPPPTPQAAITGLYVGTIETPDLGELPASLNLYMKDGALSGLFELGFTRLDVSAASVDAGRVHLRLAGFEQLVATIDGTWDRGGIRGSWTFGGDSGTVSIDRFASNTEYRTARLDLSPAEWREDLRFLANELPRMYGNAFLHVPPRPSPYLEDGHLTVEPHVLVPLTWEDYEAGRDPVLGWILRQPVAW